LESGVALRLHRIDTNAELHETPALSDLVSDIALAIGGGVMAAVLLFSESVLYLRQKKSTEFRNLYKNGSEL
jgi:hypothetical protein